MKCKICEKKFDRTLQGICISCYIDSNLPTKIKDRWWVRVHKFAGKTTIKGHFDEELASIIASHRTNIDKNKNSIIIRGEGKSFSIPLNIESIDNLSKKTGILVGKWLVYRSQPEIDSVWKIIAEATWNGILGISTKVSTLMHKRKRHVICVYTHNYLDFEDVKRVRNELQSLGIKEELCYKPDIYTYLGIYYKTTPLSPCRYRT